MRAIYIFAYNNAYDGGEKIPILRTTMPTMKVRKDKTIILLMVRKDENKHTTLYYERSPLQQCTTLVNRLQCTYGTCYDNGSTFRVKRFLVVYLGHGFFHPLCT